MSRDVQVATRTLVEALVREDLTVGCAELYEVAGALGMSDQQVRLCIRRLAADGVLVQEGRGRAATLRFLDEDASLSAMDHWMGLRYLQDLGQAPWSGLWHLAAFAVPEARRQARDALREAVLAQRAAPVHGGLYVSPYPWPPALTETAAAWEVPDCLTLMATEDLSVGGESEPVALAARLWPLAEAAVHWAELGALAQQRLDRLERGGIGQTELLVMTVEMVTATHRVSDVDPALPPELLPPGWAGQRARAVLGELWSRIVLSVRAQDRPLRMFSRFTAMAHELRGQ